MGLFRMNNVFVLFSPNILHLCTINRSLFCRGEVKEHEKVFGSIVIF